MKVERIYMWRAARLILDGLPYKRHVDDDDILVLVDYKVYGTLVDISMFAVDIFSSKVIVGEEDDVEATVEGVKNAVLRLLEAVLPWCTQHHKEPLIHFGRAVIVDAVDSEKIGEVWNWSHAVRAAERLAEKIVGREESP